MEGEAKMNKRQVGFVNIGLIFIVIVAVGGNVIANTKLESQRKLLNCIYAKPTYLDNQVNYCENLLKTKWVVE